MENSGIREGLIFENGACHKEQRTLPREQLWTVTVNGQERGSFVCSPVRMEEAAAGWLFTRGLIFSPEDIKTLEIRENSGEIYARVQKSPAPETVPRESIKISPAEISELLSRLESCRERGLHSCALVSKEHFILRQDVSRSAAADKAAGACLLQNLPTGNSVLVFSGRVSASIAEKCEALGCRILLACSGPTDLACEKAEEAGITLVCPAGKGRLCVYSCPERVQTP